MPSQADFEIPETDRIVVEEMWLPHIKGRRVDVLTIQDRVEKRGLEPQTVADRLRLDVADVHRALAYCHDHPRLTKRLRDEREAAFEEFQEEVEKERPAGVSP